MIAPGSSGAQALRDVRRGVAEAGDMQVLQVVRMVDALDERGATDEVLGPVRARLRVLQPARPLRFARLLFLPTDPLIVAPSAWRAGSPYLPRHALMVLANSVRALLEAEDATPETRAALVRADALTVGATTAEAEIVRRAGALVWPLAGKALRQLSGGDGGLALQRCILAWTAQGLPEAELQPMALALSGVMAWSVQLIDAERPGSDVPGVVLAAALAEAEELGKRAAGMMLCLLLIRAPQACGDLLASTQATILPRAALEAAADVALGWLEGETARQPSMVTMGAAGELKRQAHLLDALSGHFGTAAQRRRVGLARAALLETAERRFEASLHESVADALGRLPAAHPARAAALNAMEANARVLRAFDLEARRLGGGTKFDMLVQGAGEVLRATPGLSAIDRARLVELLAGTDAALEVLAGR